MNILIGVVLFLHGFIHQLGYTKSTDKKTVQAKFWLVTLALFIAAAVLVILNQQTWWMVSVIAIVFSQWLIIGEWKKARAGTIINFIVLFFAVTGFAAQRYHNGYLNDAESQLPVVIQSSVLTEKDLTSLPDPVGKYLRYTGCVGQPKVENFKVAFDGRIRKNEEQSWMPFHSEQYNFLSSSTRLFFMDATMMYLPVAGYHRFDNGSAMMDIRLLSLFRVQYQDGPEMDTAETVTFFNDMCFMAPATLIDQRITWDSVNGNNVHARFTNNRITISAWLKFNEQGQLLDFISNDRFAAQDDGTMKKFPWSTPAGEYKSYGSFKLASSARTIYHYPDRDLCYGEFDLLSVNYNLTAVK